MYIYKITNLITNKIYIGKTESTVEERFYQHTKNVEYDVDYYLYRSMRKHGVENFKVEPIYHTFSKYVLNKIERFFIKKFEANNPKKGYNMTDGGEGGSPNEEVRRKIGIKSKQWIRSDNLKKKLSIAQRKRFDSNPEYWSDVMREARKHSKGSKGSKWNKPAHNARPIYIVNPFNLKPLKEFSSAREASNVLFLGGENIRSVCSGYYRQYRGLFFQYKDVFDKSNFCDKVKTVIKYFDACKSRKYIVKEKYEEYLQVAI